MMEYIQRYRQWILAGFILIALLALPKLYLNDYPYRENIVTGAFFWALLAASWALLAGIGGQFSFAHMAFMAIGAYAAGLLERDGSPNTPILGIVFDNPDFFLFDPLINNAGQATPLLGILFGVIMAGVLGFIVGALVLRLRTAYLALFTIAFSELLRFWLTNEVGFTGGRNGLRIQSLWDGITREEEYYVMFVVMVGSLIVMHWMVRSRVGLFLRAIREDQDASAAMGVNVVRYKIAIFVVTSMFAGLAGAVFYHVVPLISPDSMALLQMGTLIAMAVIGGIENIYSAAAGAFFIRIIQEALRSEFQVLGTSIELGTWRLAAFGLIMIITLRFAQNGLLYPLLQWLQDREAGKKLSVSIRQKGAET